MNELIKTNTNDHVVNAAYDLFNALDLLVGYVKDNGHITSIGMAALAKAKGQGLHKPKKQWKDDDILTVALKHDIDATWNSKLIAFARELIG